MAVVLRLTNPDLEMVHRLLSTLAAPLSRLLDLLWLWFLEPLAIHFC